MALFSSPLTWFSGAWATLSLICGCSNCGVGNLFSIVVLISCTSDVTIFLISSNLLFTANSISGFRVFTTSFITLSVIILTTGSSSFDSTLEVSFTGITFFSTGETFFDFLALIVFSQIVF